MTLKIDRRKPSIKYVAELLAADPNPALEQIFRSLLDVERARAESVERSRRAKAASARRKAPSQPPQASAP